MVTDLYRAIDGSVVRLSAPRTWVATHHGAMTRFDTGGGLSRGGGGGEFARLARRREGAAAERLKGRREVG